MRVARRRRRRRRAWGEYKVWQAEQGVRTRQLNDVEHSLDTGGVSFKRYALLASVTGTAAIHRRGALVAVREHLQTAAGWGAGTRQSTAANLQCADCAETKLESGKVPRLVRAQTGKSRLAAGVAVFRQGAAVG